MKFFQFPELMIMLLVCDEMESNETLLVKGVEQFCSCRGYGTSIEFVEEYTDQSKVSVVIVIYCLYLAVGNLHELLKIIIMVQYQTS